MQHLTFWHSEMLIGYSSNASVLSTMQVMLYYQLQYNRNLFSVEFTERFLEFFKKISKIFLDSF